MPIDLVTSELSQLGSGDTVTHAYLGVATAGSSTGTPGATLPQVTAGGPAADAGLGTGDVVAKRERSSNTVQLTVTLGTQPAQSSSGG